ncbi:hypothetical protein [Lichenihabitans psoromatis]|uniref:hypothetical protein n=1 Tax=Lichenihabitans psoromatis TaxID=2528642 RepID=UPI0010369233|nr:hypothetical protein [Lichenihabitans psoromatis]
MRHAIAALLMIVLTLAGVGRALAAPSDLMPSFGSIPGVAMPICHADGGGSSSNPSDPTHHDCCDQCALSAPILTSSAPCPTIVTPASHAVLRSAVVSWAARLARARSPRQPQGPPSA